MIFQLLYNIINNSIRYNKPGGANYIKAAENNITISNTGIGIREEDIANIVNRFKKSGNTAEEGYGLGLSIVKTIVDFHGASIAANSIIFEGTTFSITFPERMLNFL